MSVNIRDLMRREKASRQRSNVGEESLPRKVQIVSTETESHSEPEVASVDRPVEDPKATVSPPRVLEETFELLSESEDDGVSEYSLSDTSKNKDSGNSSGNGFFEASDSDNSSSKRLGGNPDDNKRGNRNTSNKRKADGNSVDVEYDAVDSILEDGPSASRFGYDTDSAYINEEASNSVNSSVVDMSRLYGSVCNNVDNKGVLNDIGTMADDDVRIYDQLNTAFCSRVDFECEQILNNLDGSDIVPDSDVQLSGKGTITSDNFGKSHIRVSKAENLPEGFFDNKKVDAQARGKLTSKEASEKIKMLNKDKAEVLNEAKYLQEKLAESYHERIRLEHDALEHDETVRELIKKVETIKNDLVLDDAIVDVEVEKKPEPSDDMDIKLDDIYALEDYDDMSWRMKSIM